VEQDSGIEARMWFVPKAGRRIAERRRSIAGPTGCGLCGVESLEAAVLAPPEVASPLRIDPASVQRALAALAPVQALNQQTRAVHAAAFWTDASGIVCVREDVGRHNALDKLAGALAENNVDAAWGVILLTSRVSVEMVQKSAHIGAPVIIAVSAPTSLAIRTADAAGITLIAIARSDSFEVFTHPARLALPRTGSFRRAEVMTHAV
jgi:FdhD protein